MEWKRYPDNKPEKDILALVFNQKGYMDMCIVSYQYAWDIWVHYHDRDSFVLDISHYIEIPERPRIL